MENWKDIIGFEGLYQVSDKGRIRNRFGRIIAQEIIKGGYLRVHLWKDGKSFHRLVSRLVYECFVGTILDGMQVNHIDEDKKNNTPSNLNLMSPKENNNWGTRNERSKEKQLNDKNKSKQIKVFRFPSYEFVGIFPSIREIGRKLYCYNVAKVINGEYKQEKGYTFEVV